MVDVVHEGLDCFVTLRYRYAFLAKTRYRLDCIVFPFRKGGSVAALTFQLQCVAPTSATKNRPLCGYHSQPTTFGVVGIDFFSNQHANKNTNIFYGIK